ncbi:MAG: UxaA family hydrolase [Parvibaculales bacterium]
MKGYLRKDGRKGIRNVVLVAYLVECAHHVARRIVDKTDNSEVQLIGFPGCYPNEYAAKMMERMATHPNVGAILLISLGCEGFNHKALYEAAQQAGRGVETLIIQKQGGTQKTITAGLEAVQRLQKKTSQAEQIDMDMSELVIGTICGGSDGTSGISANPAVGKCFDRLVKENAICIFEETGELIGCEKVMVKRAKTPELGAEIEACVEKAAEYYKILGYGSFAPGNAEGGLSTQEEKSMGAYSKSGNSQISGLLKPGDIPSHGGLYLLDIVPDGEVRFGFPNISDNAEIVELIACGCHIILFTTGRGSVVGSSISPVIKICANPQTYERLSDDMDINAGRILTGKASLDKVGEEIYNYVLSVAEGAQSKSEALGHQEFILTYKQFEPIGPSCLPQ